MHVYITLILTRANFKTKDDHMSHAHAQKRENINLFYK
jgi:hypothetical protein